MDHSDKVLVTSREDAVGTNRFRLKGREILRLGRGVANTHQVHLKSGVSWPTVSKYMSDERVVLDKMKSVDLEVLYGILINGLGLSIDEALGLRLGDILEIVNSD